MEILVVDPSKSYRKLVRDILSTEKVGIVETQSGGEAFEYLKKATPDAISIAHELGDVDSFKFLKKINLNTRVANIPKFLLTSRNTQEFKREAYDAGFTEIFLKSDFATLKRALKSLMLYATTHIHAKVLYVEDTQSTADYTSYIMQQAGWEVTHVKSGEAAAALLDLKPTHFDLVVTDLVLEGSVSGIGLINLIRQSEEGLRDMPILAVSGWNDLLRQVYVLKHGAGDFIAKPFHETDFLARAINLIHSHRELLDARAAQKALYQKANLDSVTGLNNRHYIEEFGERLVQKAVSRHHSVAVAVIDIDYFKAINDEQGHLIGDQVLQSVARLVRSHGRSQDVVARYGGDELVMLIQERTQDEVTELLQTLTRQVADLHPAGVSVSISIGAGCHDSARIPALVSMLENADLSQNDAAAETTYEALFAQADKALYEAKAQGRNQAVLKGV
ncbi:MAG: diguanylate cyclase [Hydrogenovibrio sp.]|uniref:diguanylate cyclase domain-containing protein n=1 Tax=Hydrogenovibrio sp. TaxID=2065821 RepID=UPI0028706A79|nr:diguanylate cyclase [Hydrogenovibrio sp.]MDR9497797.1 diguanylate cyclase [Hydrogenovibrio sp.]